MDLIKFYMYTGVPLITCNMLFYSVSALSTSITSSQNVVKFIAEHKKTDIMQFKDELDNQDLTNKLNITRALIFDILKRYCNTKDEYEKVVTSITSKDEYIDCKQVDTLNKDNEFMMIELTNNISIFNRIDEPIKLALLSTCETVQELNSIIETVRDKIISHEQSYLNKIVSLSLQNELTNVKKLSNILTIRMNILFDILKIYYSNNNYIHLNK